MKRHPVYEKALAAWKAKPAQTVYLSCADTAKLIRTTLKARFPGVTFSIRSKVYSGGASIDISWTDGPTEKLVDAFVAPYRGADFDGMIDLKSYCTGWLMPDGSASLRQYSGTTGSGGVHPGYAFEPQGDGAVPVSFGSDFIFCNREYTVDALKRTAQAYAAKWNDELAAAILDGRLKIVEGGFRGAYFENARDFACEAQKFNGNDGSVELRHMAARRMLPAYL